MKATKNVAIRLVRLGEDERVNEWITAFIGLDFVAKAWKRPIIAPSNSTTSPVFTVIGENARQTMFSHTFVAINNEIPDPSPYPFYNSSSNNSTMIPAKNNYIKIMKQFNSPISDTLPYMPDPI